jgi:hypothetical protein
VFTDLAGRKQHRRLTPKRETFQEPRYRRGSIRAGPSRSRRSPAAFFLLYELEPDAWAFRDDLLAVVQIIIAKESLSKQFPEPLCRRRTGPLPQKPSTNIFHNAAVLIVELVAVYLTRSADRILAYPSGLVWVPDRRIGSVERCKRFGISSDSSLVPCRTKVFDRLSNTSGGSALAFRRLPGCRGRHRCPGSSDTPGSCVCSCPVCRPGPAAGIYLAENPCG